MGGLRRLVLVVGAVERDGRRHDRWFSFARVRVVGGASCGGEHQHPGCKASHRHLFPGWAIRSRDREVPTAVRAGRRNRPPVRTVASAPCGGETMAAMALRSRTCTPAGLNEAAM